MAAVARIAPGGPSSVTRTDPPKGVPPGGFARNCDGICVVSSESVAPAGILTGPELGKPGSCSANPFESKTLIEMFTAAELVLVKVQNVSELVPAAHFALYKVVSVTVMLTADGVGLEL